MTPTFVFNPQNRTDKLYSAFVQDEIRLLGDEGKGLWLTLGSKLVRTDFSGFGIQPTARLLWTSGAQTLWASVTRALRTPSDLEETYAAEGFGSANPLVILRYRNNGKFVPEALLGYESGYRRLIGSKLAVDVAAFHNRYDNLVSTELGAPYVETSPQPTHYVAPVFYGNGVYGSTSGFEIDADWKPVTRWRLNGSYSYLHMDLDTKKESKDALSTAKTTVESSPHHQVTFQSSLDLPAKFEFSQTYRYVSDLPKQLVPSYGTAGARLSWRGTKHVEFSVVGENLLQPHHAEFGGNQGVLVGIKRSVFGAITWRQ